MKKILLVIILLINCFNFNISFAEKKQYSIDGTVKDKATKELLEFATVEVRTSSDSLVLATITDSKGHFFLSLAKGDYHLKLNFLGYNQKIIYEQIKASNIYLGNIFLSPTSESLSDVIVTASSKRAKIDRDIHIVTKQMKVGVSTVKNMLENIRGITYDYLNNSLSVNNKSNVLLLVDGIRKNQDYVKNISPDRISRVEVIKQVSGKYANEGYSAIINLILKRNYTGLELYTEDRGVFSLDKYNGGDLFFSNNFASNITLTHKKINVYAMYNNQRGNTNLTREISKTLANKTLLSKSPDASLSNTHQKNKSQNMSLGIDYFINSNNSISFENSFRSSPMSKNSSAEAYSQTLYIDKEIDNEFNYQFKNIYSSKNYYSQLSYKGTINESNSIDVDLAYNYLKKNQEYTSSGDDSFYAFQATNAKKKYFNLAVNYKYKLNTSISFETGYTYTHKNNSSGSNLAVDVDYNESRNKFYVYSDLSLSETLSSKMGCAYEINKPKAFDLSHTYKSFQPLFTLMYKVNKENNIRLKYIAKSKYPTDVQLNPYLISTDILSNQRGNVLLRPSNLHALSLELNLFNNSLSIEPYYNYDSNYISPMGSIISNSSKYTYSYANMDKYETLGLNLTYSLSFFKKSLFWNFSAAYWSEQISYKGNSNRINDYSIKSNLMYRHKKYNTIAAILYKKENNKNILAYGYGAEGNDNVAILLKQAFAKNRFDITMLYYLPINTGFDYNMKSEIVNQSFSEYSNTDVSLLKNLFLLKLSYNFNKGTKVKKVYKKKFKENESLGKSIL